MGTNYADPEPSKAEVEDIQGPLVLEFGAAWCGYCQEAQPLIADAFAHYPGTPHLKIADGKGRRLGRSYGVKLWPTLIFLKDGREVGRVVRPTTVIAVRRELQSIAETKTPLG